MIRVRTALSALVAAGVLVGVSGCIPMPPSTDSSAEGSPSSSQPTPQSTRDEPPESSDSAASAGQTPVGDVALGEQITIADDGSIWVVTPTEIVADASDRVTTTPDQGTQYSVLVLDVELLDAPGEDDMVWDSLDVAAVVGGVEYSYHDVGASSPNDIYFDGNLMVGDVTHAAEAIANPPAGSDASTWIIRDSEGDTWTIRG